MFKRLWDDVAAIRERDPAAGSNLEVLLCYPGLHAILWHRLSHALWRRGLKLPARFLSNVNRTLTGIEIHPGAQIGARVFIDHGMAVMIGETAVIGDNVTLYQGVTLGGVSLDPGKRHPTIEDDVVVGAGAAVLGPFTVGRGARVGANAVVLREVAPGDTMIGIPAHSAANKRRRPDQCCFQPYGTEPGEAEDPTIRAVDELCKHVDMLHARIETLEAERVQERKRELLAS